MESSWISYTDKQNHNRNEVYESLHGREAKFKLLEWVVVEVRIRQWMLDIIEDILSNMDKRYFSCGVFIDFIIIIIDLKKHLIRSIMKYYSINWILAVSGFGKWLVSIFLKKKK